MRTLARRAFLASGGASVAAALLPAAASAARPRTLTVPPGLQLWTVKDALTQDFDGTLRQLKRMGYARVEAAGWVGRTPDAFRKGVTAAGLECVSCHFGMGDLMEEHRSKLAQARDAGARYLVASSPWAPRPLDPAKPWPVAVAEAMTLDAWRRNADVMNQVGATARTMGLRFGYHNHPGEFLTIDGVFVWDELLRRTNPADVCFELDLGWVAGAGLDPAAILAKDAARIELLHVKDIAARERTPGRIVDNLQTTPIGAGSIDWAATFAAADKARIASWFVEQEPPFTESPLKGLAQSLSYIRTVGA